jgi:hypothetical protein
MSRASVAAAVAANVNPLDHPPGDVCRGDGAQEISGQHEQNRAQHLFFVGVIARSDSDEAISLLRHDGDCFAALLRNFPLSL